jgi:hypothetical protein
MPEERESFDNYYCPHRSLNEKILTNFCGISYNEESRQQMFWGTQGY